MDSLGPWWWLTYDDNDGDKGLISVSFNA